MNYYKYIMFEENILNCENIDHILKENDMIYKRFCKCWFIYYES